MSNLNETKISTLDEGNALDAGDVTDVNKMKKITWITYIAFISSFVTGIGFIAGMIIAYLKRAEAEGTIYKSHLEYLIKTAWITIAVGVLGAFTMVFVVGLIILFVLPFWFIYRLIKGALLMNDNKPIPVKNK